MAMTRTDGGEALSLDALPAEDSTEDGRSSAPPGVLGHLRAVWKEYVAENRKGWSRLVDEQVKDPSLD